VAHGARRRRIGRSKTARESALTPAEATRPITGHAGGTGRPTVPITIRGSRPERRGLPAGASRSSGSPLPAQRTTGSGRTGRAAPPPDVNLQLPTLTGLRGVAALMVFTRHIYVEVEDVIPAIAFLGDIGYSGVTFFFILSGYVLAWSTGPGTDSAFWWRRFARVYPLYFVSVWIWLALAWYFGMFGEFGSKLFSILPSLLLLQAWVPDQSIYFGWGGAVLWSLSCEAFFYLAFPLIYRRLAGRDTRGRLRMAAMVVLPTSLISVTASFAGSRFDLAAYANPAVRIGEFVLGVALGLIAREGVRGTRRMRTALSVGSTVWFVVAFLLGSDYGHRSGLIDSLLIPAFAALIFLVGTREADGGRIRVLGSRPVVYFGEASYAFYLVHPVALTIGYELGWFDVDTAVEAGLGLFACFAMATALAAALHHSVERPARKLLMRRRLSRSRHRFARRMLPLIPWRSPQPQH